MRNVLSGAAARVRQRTIRTAAAGLLAAVVLAVPLAAAPASAHGHGGFFPGTSSGFHGGGHVDGTFGGHEHRHFIGRSFDRRDHHDHFGWGWCEPWDTRNGPYPPSYSYDSCW